MPNTRQTKRFIPCSVFIYIIHSMKTIYHILGLIVLLSFRTTLQAQEQSITLEPEADNTIYEENDNSNGAGVYLFAGATNNNNARRTLVRFDLSGIPAGATVTGAELQLSANRGDNSDIAVHRLLAAWGEGTSQAPANQGQGTDPANGDATWNFRFHQDSSWSIAGGDFVAEASATANLANGQRASWNSEDLIADVQQWVNDSTTNNGWILVGPEDVPGSAMRMGSREGSTPPELIVTYEITTTNLPVLRAEDLRVTVRPNPASEQLWVDWGFSDQPEQLSVTVQTVLGQPLKQLTITPVATGQQMIPVSNLTSGWYLVTIRTEAGMRSERFFKR
jgi:hypothetical protein